MELSPRNQLDGLVSQLREFRWCVDRPEFRQSELARVVQSEGEDSSVASEDGLAESVLAEGSDVSHWLCETGLHLQTVSFQPPQSHSPPELPICIVASREQIRRLTRSGAREQQAMVRATRNFDCFFFGM